MCVTASSGPIVDRQPLDARNDKQTVIHAGLKLLGPASCRLGLSTIPRKPAACLSRTISTIWQLDTKAGRNIAEEGMRLLRGDCR